MSEVETKLPVGLLANGVQMFKRINGKGQIGFQT